MSQMNIKDLDFQELLSEQDIVSVMGGMPPEGYGSILIEDENTTIIEELSSQYTTVTQKTVLNLGTVYTTSVHISLCVPYDLPPYYICY